MKWCINFRSFSIIILSLLLVYSCSKGGSGGTSPPANPCAGINIIVSATKANPTAPGTSDGSITATATGSSSFTFSINSGAFQSSGTFSNLAAGTYTITAKNADGCTGSASFTLTAPDPCAGVTITVSSTLTNPTGAATNNGSIVATASGSTGFTFNINGGTFQSSGTFSSLAAGSYVIIAKNATGCTGSATVVLTAPNPCSGVTITVVTTIAGNTPCVANSGSITATPTGGTAAYTFSLNSGTFQVSNLFSNLGAGTYNITAKDANGCTGSNSAIVNNSPAGSLFSLVKTLIQNNCSSCHNATVANGGMDFSIDCNIVANKDRVKARAVDGNPSPMPDAGLLPASERQKITNWINAGGKFTD